MYHFQYKCLSAKLHLGYSYIMLYAFICMFGISRVLFIDMYVRTDLGFEVIV